MTPRSIRLMGGAVLAVAASACTVGPNFTPPAAPVVTRYTAPGAAVSYTPDIFGGTHRQIEQQVALADFQRDQLDAAYLTLTGNAVTQAIQVAAVRAQQKAIADILTIDR